MTELTAGGGESLGGKVALVTGAGTRVGAAIARALGASGMRVLVHYHASGDGAKCTAEAIVEAGGEASAVRADLYDHDQARGLVDETLERFGRLDLLVPSAANFDRVAYDDVGESHWQRAMTLNLHTPFVMAHHATAALRRVQGNMVFITCTSATRPYRHHLPYVVSKGALRHLMRTLAIELAPEVRVNAVAPGTVLPPPNMSAQELDALKKNIPLGRIGSAEDVAQAVLHLARSPFITGQELVVDGGHNAG